MKECGDLAHDNLSINVPENGRAELLYSKMMCVVLCFSGREADRGRPSTDQARGGIFCASCFATWK